MSKKQPTTVRTTISVPRDLKRRMDKVTDEVNWSALACRAFEDKLAEIAVRKEQQTMDDVIERLRASKRKSGDKKYKEGYATGQEWVKHANGAEAAELERLAAFYEERSRDTSYDWSDFFSESGSSAYHVTERLYFELHPEHDGCRDEAAAFWEAAIGNGPEDEANLQNYDFLRGFADGALDTWREIEAKI